jgi:hypothetical protein
MALPGASWRKSSRSGTQSDCVEMAWYTATAARLAVRDSKNTTGPILLFPQPSIAALIHDLKSGHRRN